MNNLELLTKCDFLTHKTITHAHDSGFSWLCLKLTCSITLACKGITWIKLQCSYSFSLAVYEYERHFIPTSPDFPRLDDNGLKIYKKGCYIACFYSEVNLKFSVLHTWCVSKGVLFTPMYNSKLFLSSFPKTIFKRNIISCKWVYITQASLL